MQQFHSRSSLRRCLLHARRLLVLLRLQALSLIYLVVGLLSFALCAYSFVGSEWLGVAVRPAPGWHPPSAPPPAFDALGTREAWSLWLDPWE